MGVAVSHPITGYIICLSGNIRLTYIMIMPMKSPEVKAAVELMMCPSGRRIHC